MKKALLLLQEITLEELQIKSLSEASAKKIGLFIRQFQIELKKHMHPITEESLLKRVFFEVNESSDSIIDADSSTKIELLRTRIFTEKNKPKLNHSLNTLSTVLKNLNEQPLDTIHESIVDKGIKKHMDVILKTRNSGNITLSAQNFLDLGTFIQEQFPGINLDKTRKKLQKYADQYLVHELPESKSISILSDARIRLLQDAITNNDLSAIYKYDALGKGINVYSMLVGEARLEALLVEASMNEIEDAMNPIISTKYHPPQILSKIIAANNLIIQLSKLNMQCLKDLSKIIEAEAKKLPDEILNEFILDNSLPDTCEININLVIHALVTNSDKSQALNDYASDNLKSAAQSYLVVEKLNQILKTEDSAEERLNRYKIEFEEPHIQYVLTKNPDTLTTKFMKVVSYLLSKAINLATFGAIPYTEKPQLDSHQQNLFKETTKNLRDADIKELCTVLIK